MSNDQLQSIMALVHDYAIMYRSGSTFSERHAASKEIESAIREAIAAPGVAQGPLTDEQRKDLLMAALYLSCRDDDSCVLLQSDAERIVELLCDLSGIELPDITAEQPERPPYCGSGHCSCIECPYGETNEP